MMGMPCSSFERCQHCPPRAPRVRCWWVISNRPWRLCRECYVAATGEQPELTQVAS